MPAASTTARNMIIASIWFFAARSARPATEMSGATTLAVAEGDHHAARSQTFAQNALATKTISSVRIPDQTNACTVVIMASLPS